MHRADPSARSPTAPTAPSIGRSGRAGEPTSDFGRECSRPTGIAASSAAVQTCRLKSITEAATRPTTGSRTGSRSASIATDRRTRAGPPVHAGGPLVYREPPAAFSVHAVRRCPGSDAQNSAAAPSASVWIDIPPPEPGRPPSIASGRPGLVGANTLDLAGPAGSPLDWAGPTNSRRIGGRSQSPPSPRTGFSCTCAVGSWPCSAASSG
jgi:hypothetical protein